MADVKGETKLELLKQLSNGNLDVLEPELTGSVDTGYRYPDVDALFDLDSATSISMLEELAGDGFLNRELVDRIHLCPDCGRYTLNFREVCPDCRTVRITLTDMIHHYSCGNVGPEIKHKVGSKLICTKCDTELQHIGIDYEKVNTLYYCDNCGNKFEDPEVSCRCLSCGEEHDISSVEERKIHLYELSSQGTRSVEQQSLELAQSGPALFDEDIDVFSFEMFREQLSIEFHRAKRYDRPGTLLLAEPVPVELSLDQMETAMEAGEYINDMKRLAEIFKDETRTADFLAVYQDRQFAMILSETDREGAGVFARRLTSRLEDGERPFEHQWKLHVGLTEMSDAEDPDHLMEETIARLQEARHQDESTIIIDRSREDGS